MIIVEHLYTLADAVHVAATLQAHDEDGWTYAAIHDPKGTGGSYIAVYDEGGELVGKY